MPPNVKVQNVEKTLGLLAFCSTNAESATTKCDPENSDEDEAPKPSSSEEWKKMGLLNCTVHA